MNIFYLHKSPTLCAQQHCDKHVVKMLIEYAQLLSTAHRVLDGELFYGRTTNGRKITRYFHPDPAMNQELYKATHINHPSAIWVRQSKRNYEWLYDMWTALAAEYTYRYGKEHESFRKLEYHLLMAPKNISHNEFTEPTPAMQSHKECIVENDSIASYRNYYKQAKKEFATWKKRETPDWWEEYNE
jgi:hypothetical protein